VGIPGFEDKSTTISRILVVSTHVKSRTESIHMLYKQIEIERFTESKLKLGGLAEFVDKRRRQRGKNMRFSLFIGSCPCDSLVRGWWSFIGRLSVLVIGINPAVEFLGERRVYLCSPIQRDSLKCAN